MGRNLPRGLEVQVRQFSKLCVMNALQGRGLADELHLYQWSGTVARSYASWHGDPRGTRSGGTELFAVRSVLGLVFRVKSFRQSAGHRCFWELPVHAGES